MNNLTKFTAGALLITSMVLTPVIGFAKEKENRGSEHKESKTSINKDKKDDRREDRREDRKEDKKEKGCIRAFGHFFAKGWLKNNNSVSINENCFLPFGIGKKFGGQASTTPDTIPPVVKNIVGVVSTSTVQANWKTNELSTSKLYYSTSAGLNTATASFVENTTLKTTHSLKVSSLPNGTKYYLVIESKDGSGNTTKSPEFSLTTQGSIVVTDTTAPILSSISTGVSSTTINVSWITNESATSKVYYKAGTVIDISTSTTPFIVNNTLLTSHSIVIPNLGTSTEYRIVIESKDSTGNTATSSVIGATTLSI